MIGFIVYFRESTIDILQLQNSDKTAGPATSGGKYVVDPKRDRHFRSTNKGKTVEET